VPEHEDLTRLAGFEALQGRGNVRGQRERVCQEIVRRHRGQLFVKEGPDVLVEIRLPRERDTIAA